MPRFALTRAAVADLKAIGRYTHQTWGLAQRNRYLALLDDSFHRLADNAQLGWDCSDLRAGYRKYHIGKHVVFYRQIEDRQIEIVRVLHDRMDMQTRIGDLS
jgi:toxin ParE1/3/4